MIMRSLRGQTLTSMHHQLSKLLQSSFARTVRRNTPILHEQEQKEIQQQFQKLEHPGATLIQERVRKDVLEKLSYEGEDPSPNKLVNRPGKGAVWGLGGQLVLASKKMHLQGVKEDPDEIVKFLELHQVKNIYIHDWKAEQDPDINRRRYSIIGSCFSSRHCWRTGLELKNAFNKNILKAVKGRHGKPSHITALLNGSKDDEWTLIQYKDFEISLMTEEQREAVDLEWKWNNPVSEKIVEKHARMDNDKKKRKNNFDDFD